MSMVPLSHYCCMNGDRQGKSYISLKRSDPYCVKCIHRCVKELAGPGSNQNRVHVCMREGILIMGASEREGREGHGVKEDLRPQAHESQS